MGCQPLSAGTDLAGEAAGGAGSETRGWEDALPAQRCSAAISDHSERGWVATGGWQAQAGVGEDPFGW